MGNPLKVISLWAGPGAGKSTTAAALFAEMKRQRFSVELVVEFAKELTYEKAWDNLADQFLVLAEQNHRLDRLQGHVEWAITDSPLALTLAYCKPEQHSFYKPIVEGLWQRYNNFAFLLQRTGREYQSFGRKESLDRAQELDRKIYGIAEDFYTMGRVNPDSPTVTEDIMGFLKPR